MSALILFAHKSFTRQQYFRMNMCYPRGGTFLIYSTHEENPCNLCEANSFHSFVIYAHPSNHYFCTKFFEVVFLNWCFKCFGCFRCFRCSYFSLLNYSWKFVLICGRFLTTNFTNRTNHCFVESRWICVSPWSKGAERFCEISHPLKQKPRDPRDLCEALNFVCGIFGLCGEKLVT